MLVVELVLCAIGIASAVVVSIGFGSLPWDDSLGEIVGAFGVLMVLVAVYIRIWWARTGDGRDSRTRLMWYLPAAMTAVITPGLLSEGTGADWPPFVDVLWFLVFAYLAALLGFLALFLFLLPLEALGRGILHLVTGKPGGGWLLFWGTAGALLTTFVFVGAFALDDLPPGRAGALPVLFALLGIPFGYTVESETLLWIARALALVLTAMLLASAHFGGRQREREEKERTADRETLRQRRLARREAQLARDRAMRDGTDAI
ncbi:hypothetical protein [Microbacterium sp. NPDC056569]|uniref:hypothetical protein n=1 Tax=Microbacterium sp. NPDC056569 TaxID=3345867 RepID=UPI00366DB859